MSMGQPNNHKLPCRPWKLCILISKGHSLLQLDQNQPIVSQKENLPSQGIQPHFIAFQSSCAFWTACAAWWLAQEPWKVMDWGWDPREGKFSFEEKMGWLSSSCSRLCPLDINLPSITLLLFACAAVQSLSTCFCDRCRFSATDCYCVCRWVSSSLNL